MTADEIKAIRNLLGMSQSAFAMRVGVSVDTMRAYEQGVRNPSNRVILRLREIETEALAKGATA